MASDGSESARKGKTNRSIRIKRQKHPIAPNHLIFLRFHLHSSLFHFFSSLFFHDGQQHSSLVLTISFFSIYFEWLMISLREKPHTHTVYQVVGAILRGGDDNYWESNITEFESNDNHSVQNIFRLFLGQIVVSRTQIPCNPTQILVFRIEFQAFFKPIF